MSALRMGRRPDLAVCARAALVALSLVAGGCKSAGVDSPGAPALLVKLLDIPNTIVVGHSDSIAVRVTDSAGKAVSGATVLFALASTGGSVSSSSVTSGADGIAAVLWTMGDIANAQSVTARLPNVSGAPVTFTATPLAGPAATLAKLSADPPSAPTSSPIDSLVVLVSDQFGNPAAGAPVTFSVTAGGGTVSPSSTLTGANGRAAARWTLGPTKGADSASAVVVGLSAPAITFATTAFSVASLAINGPRLIVIDSGTATPLTAVAKDFSGNVVAGAQFSLVSESSVATVSNGTVTGAQRGTTFVLAVSVDNANARDSVMIIVAVPNGPVAMTDLSRFDLKSDTTLTVTFLINMRTSSETLGSGTAQITWDPTLLTYQGDADGASGVGATVNSATGAAGSLTLTFANAQGFTGSVQLRKVTFHSTTTVAHSGTLHLAVSDLAAAGTFDNLLPVTVVVSYPLVIR